MPCVPALSEHYYCFIPTDPGFVPTSEAQAAAIEALRAALPFLEDIEALAEPRIEFFDCGENFLEVRCPNCGDPVETERWTSWMDADWNEEGGFKLDGIALPCCGADSNLNALLVIHPAGLGERGQFAIDQYLLGGGKVIAMLDAFSFYNRMAGARQQQVVRVFLEEERRLARRVADDADRAAEATCAGRDRVPVVREPVSCPDLR